jgi:hypothetical protein
MLINNSNKMSLLWRECLLGMLNREKSLEKDRYNLPRYNSILISFNIYKMHQILNNSN